MSYIPDMSLDHFAEGHQLPQMYWDVMSAEQRIHAICKAIDDVCRDLVGVHGELDEHEKEIQELNELFMKFMESGFDDYYAEQVIKWIDEHLKFIFEHTAKQVFFGLTEDGYFCAYIPESWSDIQFDTGMVYGTPSYGRLVLRYDVDGSGVIDNTGYGQGIGIEIANELQAQINRLNKTCYINLRKDE